VVWPSCWGTIQYALKATSLTDATH